MQVEGKTVYGATGIKNGVKGRRADVGEPIAPTNTQILSVTLSTASLGEKIDRSIFDRAKAHNIRPSQYRDLLGWR